MGQGHQGGEHHGRLSQNAGRDMTEEVDEFEFFLEKAWSDGLPVVTPTAERLEAMLRGTKRGPDELVGNLPPAMEPATVRTVAIHAVMAGCKPD